MACGLEFQSNFQEMNEEKNPGRMMSQNFLCGDLPCSFEIDSASQILSHPRPWYLEDF